VRPSGGWLRGAGALALALVIIYAAGGFLGAVPYPPAAIAQVIIKATPGDFATRMIEALGHWAMRLLAVGVHLGALAAGGAAGAFADRAQSLGGRARRALGAAGLLLVVASLAALGAPGGLSVFTLLAYLAGAYAFARVCAGARLSAALEVEARDDETPLDAIRRSRRRFLVRTGAAVAGFLVGGAATLRFITGRQPVNVEITAADLSFDPPPDDPDFPEVGGLSPEITSNDDFYTVDINLVKPAVDHEGWTLRIHGLVDSPYALGYQELQTDFEIVEMAHTLTCISNEVGGDLISTAVWRGVRLADVLERGGLRDGVVDIVFRAAEGYSDSITLAKALEETTLVVFGMNGTSLPREHGFPARVIVPGIYGMKNVKWLTEIEAVDHDYQGYWMVRGWSDIATVKTQSRIDTPSDRSGVGLPAMLAGVAWAGDRKVMKVEVSQDGGKTWDEALLKRELSPLTWRLWATGLEAGSGRREVLVRATDGDGRTQPDRSTRPHPEGADGLHTIVLEVE
jgi:DMSO/TMAO reductase YedYZ molybdopterin-dependent catalytic subunit